MVRISLIRLVGIAALAIWAFLRLWDPLPIEALRDAGIGTIIDASAGSANRSPVVIIDIDDASISEIKRWPWPRELIARLVTRIGDARPAAIGLSLVFTDSAIDAGTGNASSDAVFAEALESLPVTLAVSPMQFRSGNGRITPKPTLVFGSTDFQDSLPTTPALTPVVPALRDAAKGLGVIAFQLSHGGVPRRFPAFLVQDGIPVPSLPLEMVRIAENAAEISASVQLGGIADVKIGSRQIRTGPDGLIWFPVSSRISVQRISAIDVLNGNAALTSLAGRYVLVGVSGSGLSPTYLNGNGESLTGVDALAMALNAILTNTSKSYPAFALLIEFSLTLFALLALIIAAGDLRLRKLIAVAFPVILSLPIIGWFLIMVFSAVIDFTLPAIVAVMATAILFVIIYGMRGVESGKAIARRDAEIRDLRQRRAQAELSQGGMSATLSHEMRQPLAAMKNYLGAIKRLAARAEATTPEELARYAERAGEQIVTMSALMSSVSEDARDKMTLRIEHDFAKIVVEAARQSIDAAGDKTIDLTIRAEPDLPPALINQQQISQVVRNIVSNAIEAAIDKDISAPLRIAISIRSDRRDQILVEIEDNAGGIEDALIGKIFQPSFSTKESGSGIGLALCRDIVEAHGGTIEWRPIPAPPGSLFRFTVQSVAES